MTEVFLMLNRALNRISRAYEYPIYMHVHPPNPALVILRLTPGTRST